MKNPYQAGFQGTLGQQTSQPKSQFNYKGTQGGHGRDSGLDLTDLKNEIDQEIENSRQYTTMADKRKTKEAGRNSPEFVRNIPAAADSSQLLTNRSNSIINGFKMNFDHLDNTPVRPSADRSTGSIVPPADERTLPADLSNNRQNRTFADSVLLGMKQTQPKKENDDVSNLDGKSQNYYFKADISELSSTPQQLFRMGMDRPSDKGSRTKRDQPSHNPSLDDKSRGSADRGRKHEALNERDDSDDGISDLSISQCGRLVGALDKSANNVSQISGMYTKPLSSIRAGGQEQVPVIEPKPQP